jgi:TRAP-type uncharacterized transport system substrate-binding protein
VKKQVPVAYLRLEKPGPANFGLMEEGHLVSYGVNLFASTKTPDDLVYQVVKAIHANTGDFGKVFPPLNMLAPDAMAQEVDGVQYHSGAEKFYKEIGQWPPKAL